MKLAATWQEPGGEPVTTVTAPVDVILWERWSGSKVGKGSVGMEDMCRMVHTAAVRAKQTTAKDFDEWVGGLESVDVEPVTPTRPGGAQSPGS